jgi:hypothetical protein
MNPVTLQSASDVFSENAAPPASGSIDDIIASATARPGQAQGLWSDLVLSGRFADARTLAEAVPGADGAPGQAGSLDRTTGTEALYQPVALKGYQVDLQQQEGLGGHTISLHVGKSEGFLKNRITTPLVDTPVQTVYIREASSFSSLASANKLVNYTLSQNSAVVDAVASGKLKSAFITSRLDSVTGISAVTQGPNNTSLPPEGRSLVQETHGVGVFIVQAPDTKDGFVVVTAYPTDRTAVPPLFQ